MGYRSDVTVVMYPKNDKDFALLKLYVDENLPDQFEVCEADTGLKYLVCEMDSVKWYQGYEDVDVYTRAFSEWDTMFRDEADPEGEPLFHYEFVRFGEDTEDIVYDCSNYCDHILGIERRAYVSIS